MTNTKKVVAMVLSFLMIFSSLSVMASAYDPTTDGGDDLTITANIYKDIDGTLTEAEKVAPGDEVTVRVSVGTEYYSTDATFLFFYDNDFFSDSYGAGLNDLTVNEDATGFSGSFLSSATTTSAIVSDLVDDGLITAEFAAAHNFFAVFVEGPGTQFKYDDSDWLFSFDLEVLSTASGVGTFFIEDATIAAVGNNGFINVPKAVSNPYGAAYDMWDWNADWDDGSCYDEVTTASSYTFDPVGGTWADTEDSEVRTFNGTAGASFTLPAVTNEGKTLIGWYVDTGAAVSELSDCEFGPEGPTAYDENEDVTLVALWRTKVNVTIDYNDGKTEPVTTSVTPGFEFAAVTNPTRTGYDFRGWSTEGPNATTGSALPSTYPSVPTTYYAVWVKAVTMTFFDTYTNQTIGTVSGYAGDALTAAQTAAVPVPADHAGYYNVAVNVNGGSYIPEVPANFPAEDTTYYAYYDVITCAVKYYVNGAFAGQTSVTLGAEIPTDLFRNAPAGYTVDGWYTDTACTTALADGATATTSINLYGKYEQTTYTVTFDPNDGAFATIGDTEGNYTEELVFMAAITLPTENPTRTGYVFTGWAPMPSVLDTPADTTFYATWEATEYTVTYKLDAEDAGEEYKLYYGDPMESPADPYKEGTTFAGWALSTAPNTAVALPATMPDSNLVYIAVFSNDTKLITFLDADGLRIESVTQNQVYGNVIVFPADNPTKTGWSFDHWEWTYRENDENDTPVAFTAAPTTVPAYYESIATPVFTINSYKIEYITDDTDYNKTGDDADVWEYQEAVTPYAPVKAGYTFHGWFEDDEYTTSFNFGETYNMPAEDLTLYGYFTRDAVDVRFFVDYGDGEYVQLGETEAIDIGQAINVPETPAGTIPGYNTFDGWYTDDTCTTEFVDGTLASDPVDIYAKFTQTIYNVTFKVPVRISDVNDANYGYLDYDSCTDASFSVSDVYGTSVTAQDAADITGYYTFVGWTETELTGKITGTDAATVTPVTSVQEGDKTYYAVYEREAVYLIPLDSQSTAVIDRNGKSIGYWEENYTESTFPTDGSALWFVTGITPARISARNNLYLTKYLGVNGDGTVTVVPNGSSYGTGTLIKVTDNVTGEVVEEFYSVIYGDVNGDGLVNGTDTTALETEVNGKNVVRWSRRGTYNYCKVKAADLFNTNLSRITINGSDTTKLSEVISGKSTLDQTTGVLTAKVN